MGARVCALKVGRAKPIPVSSARTGRAVHTGTGRDGFHPPATGSATTSRLFSPHSGARWHIWCSGGLCSGHRTAKRYPYSLNHFPPSPLQPGRTPQTLDLTRSVRPGRGDKVLTMLPGNGAWLTAHFDNFSNLCVFQCLFDLAFQNGDWPDTALWAEIRGLAVYRSV